MFRFFKVNEIFFHARHKPFPVSVWFQDSGCNFRIPHYFYLVFHILSEIVGSQIINNLHKGFLRASVQN